MSWLKPVASRSDNNPHASVVAFLEQEGFIGRVVLETLNGLDFCHCLYDDFALEEDEPLLAFMNPDEYLGYAKRIVAELKQVEERWWTDIQVLEAAVRAGFHSEQLARGFIREEDLVQIARQVIQQYTGGQG